jgi:heme-degrading monooxygenase HmoA
MVTFRLIASAKTRTNRLARQLHFRSHDNRAGERHIANMVTTIFRSRLRREHPVEYKHWSARMNKLAAGTAGLVSIKKFTADDGECVSIVKFASEDTPCAWREHPEHHEAQKLGRQRFCSEYHIQVCTPVRHYQFPGKS